MKTSKEWVLVYQPKAKVELQELNGNTRFRIKGFNRTGAPKCLSVWCESEENAWALADQILSDRYRELEAVSEPTGGKQL